jgi:hypothetical protein
MRRAAVVAALALASAAPARAVDVPADTPLAIRLTTHVSSRHSRPGDPVGAVLLAPVKIDGREVLAAGCTLRGRVREAGKEGGLAKLRLDFPELVDEEGRTLPIGTRVLTIDDAKESVASDGRIEGVRPMRRLPSRFVALLMLVAHAHPVALALFEAGRLVVRAAEHAAIDYPPGVELTLSLEAPLEIEPYPPSAPPPAVDPSLPALARTLPLRTRAPRLHRDSDLTNVLLVGSRAQLQSAFVEAGWTEARPMCMRARVRGLVALATHRGYKTAPVSRLELAGRPPDLVYEKQNDTLAKRHHVRIWLRSGGEGLEGDGVWVGAASHDVALAFDHRDHIFTHRIDPRIDAERDKIVNDLQLAGRVAAASLVERPGVPSHGVNATGDTIETDGRMAVLVLRRTPAGPGQDGAAHVPAGGLAPCDCGSWDLCRFIP